MRLRRRVQLLLVGFASLFAVSVAMNLYLIEERDDLLRTVERRIEPARDTVAVLLTAVVDQETGQRGFIITGDETFLQPYEEGGIVADDALERLRALLGREEALAPAIDRIAARLSAWRQLGAEFEIEAKRAGRDDEVVALVAGGTARQLFDRLRMEITTLRDRLSEQATSEREELDNLRETLARAEVAAASSALLALAMAAVLLRRWVTKPLEELDEAVVGVAGGELRRTIPSPGPPEIADLGAAVESMRRRLLVEVDEAARARDALAQRAQVVIGLAERLRPAVTDGPPGIRFAARLTPARGMAAGDWCDLVPLADGRATIALFDVSGHDADAAVFALRTKELTLAAIRSGHGPGAALEWVATQLGETEERFFTGVIVEVDDEHGRLRYASAGHPPLLIVDGEQVSALPATGPLAGPLAASWTTAQIPLAAGAVVVAVSDGLLEVRDRNGVEFGLDRLERTIIAAGTDDLNAVADRCIAAADTFGADTQRHDDLTLVLFGREPL